MKKKDCRCPKNRPCPKGRAQRIVPLRPRPKTVLAEPGSELFDGRPRSAPANANFTYRGGPLLTNVKVQIVLPWWDKTASDELAPKISGFFEAMLVSSFMDQLTEFSQPGQTIGRGTLIGTKIIPGQAPGKQITDAQLRAQLLSWIKSKVLPAQDANTLYFMYLPPGLTSVMDAKNRSCRQYCGYHDAIEGSKINTNYAVIAYPDNCIGCRGGMDTFEDLTSIGWHELAEAVTDPVPGKGCYDDQNGEIGDACAWNNKKVTVTAKDGSQVTYTIQKIWSNKQNGCV